MSDWLDQIFIRIKQLLLASLAGAPDWVMQIASALINIFALLGVFLTLFALISVLERKILGRMQNRYGPNRVGPFGLFQPVADGIKMLIKEDIVPARADKVVHFLAPILIAATAILALGVIPYGQNMTPFAIDGGILFFFAVGSTTELAVFMAGWGSNNKFSMLGAMRAIAQMVSYELPLIITTLPVVMVVGALSPDAIVAAQSNYSFGFVPHWFVTTPWGAAAFVLFFVSGLVAVPRRLACTGPRPSIHSILYLVLRETGGVTFRLHLASRNSAPHPNRPHHEFRLEIHVADGLHLHSRRRRLALRGARACRVAVVACRDRNCLHHIVDLAGHAKKICHSHLSFRRMNNIAFILIAILTLAAALAAASLPKLIHAALSFAVTFVGVAAFFFLLGAEFVGLVQVFVYIGAVAVLIVFTILLTRRDVGKGRGFNWGGVVIAIAVFGGLLWAIFHTPAVSIAAPNIGPLTVKRIGEALMTSYVWPLQCVGVLLTAALIGALILVMEEKR